MKKVKKKNIRQKYIFASIICPLFNEVNYINTNLIKFINEIKASKKNYEIIIVDNNSTDGTSQKLRELKKKNIYKNIRFIFNKNNLGKGGSVKKACKIFDRKKYNSLKINSSGFDFEFELICKFAKKNFLIDEFYSNYKPRSFAEGKKLIAWKDGSKILIIILKTLFR